MSTERGDHSPSGDSSGHQVPQRVEPGRDRPPRRRRPRHRDSYAAFARSNALRVRLETDVRVTADGVCVAFHDPGLRRITGLPLRLDALSWPEVSRVRRHGGETVPRLDDVLVRMYRLLDAGVDGIISDRPDLLREVLLARGSWTAPSPI